MNVPLNQSAGSPKSSSNRLELLAPLSGPVVPLPQVPDPVFSQRLVGDGIAIDPTSEMLLSPCVGQVVQLHPSGHAISIKHESGTEILLHIGLDTVKMKGRGFTPKVKSGDFVIAGQVLIEFDSDLLATEAKSLISLMILAEAPEHSLKVNDFKNVRAGRDAVLNIDFSKSASLPKPDAPQLGMEMSDPVNVRLATGLHARPAALLANCAKRFSSQIEIRKGDKVANAKSVVAILGLEVQMGDAVCFAAQGADARAAVWELAVFLGHIEESPSAAATPEKAKATRSTTQGALLGVAASPGIAMGLIRQVRAEAFEIKEQGLSVVLENENLAQALRQATLDLGALRDEVKSRTDATQAAIFGAHQELLDDPDLLQTAYDLIKNGKSAAFAWNYSTQSNADRLAHLNNELMANRANDLRDVGRRVLRLLSGVIAAPARPLEGGTILVAENLTPSDTAQLDRDTVLGFCTTTGGATSHVAILARSLGIPAIAGIDRKVLELSEGTEVILDGDRGELRMKPTAEEKRQVQETQQRVSEQRKVALTHAAEHAKTLDGRLIEVGANIGGVSDAREAVEMGCDGVGLLRSEFLFLERATAPSEDEQYRVYQEIADILGSRPLTIRTLDVGGDKPLRYLPIDAEENPFLGVRGLRVGFMKPDIFREQLRAILRVETKGTLNVMFPMVSMIEEFHLAKAMLEEERIKLGAPAVKVGIMIEVPSAALLADIFAPEVDFFSIGTNDLTQYTLAMDRGHKDLAKQVDGLHPSVLKLIDLTVQAAHRHGKWVGVCGGIAGDPKAVPILLGLGVDELSVSVPVIPIVKSQVRGTRWSEEQALAQRALAAPTGKAVRELNK